MPMIKQVHTPADKLQPVLAGQRGKIQGMAKLRYCLQRSPTQCLTQVLVQLCLELLRVIVQDCQIFGIGSNLQSQGFLYWQPFFSQCSGKNRTHIVTLIRTFASSDAEQIILCTEWHTVYCHHRLGNVRWILVIYLTGAKHHHSLAV